MKLVADTFYTFRRKSSFNLYVYLGNIMEGKYILRDVFTGKLMRVPVDPEHVALHMTKVGEVQQIREQLLDYLIADEMVECATVAESKTTRYIELNAILRKRRAAEDGQPDAKRQKYS